MMEIRHERQLGGFIAFGHRVLCPSGHRGSDVLSVDKLGYAELAGCPSSVGPASRVVIALDAMEYAPALLLELSSRLDVVSL